MSRAPENTIYRHLRHIIVRHNPSLHAVAEWIPFLPISARKVFLTIAQTGLDETDSRILSSLDQIIQEHLIGPSGAALGRRLIYSLVQEIVVSPFNRSLVMMLVRCEANLANESLEEIVRDGVYKEIHASQNTFSVDQVLNYSTLFGNCTVQWSPEAPITPAWVRNASFLADKIASSMSDLSLKVLYPAVQRKKNMSQSTCRNLLLSGYTPPEGIRDMDLRTIDLEIHRYHTGVEVQGELEMRWAWRYNDLKPRVYYCTGGTPYWVSRYMREIAVSLMNAWPVTHHYRRRDPDMLSWVLHPDQYLTMWDYTSFTTSLSELKFFVFWMSRFLEDDLRVRQHPLRLFDLRDGVVLKNIWDLLDEYNEGVNEFAEYSIHRVVDLVGMGPDLLAHHNSGGLGVLGNIGLSTQLHGIHIGPIIGNSDQAVSVGDDAMAIQNQAPNVQLIPHINRIGYIHPEKFEVLAPLGTEYDEHVWKFLKRRLTRDSHGIHLDVLYDFPILATVFNIDPGVHTIRKEETIDIIHKFIGQVSSLFWRIHQRGFDFFDADIDLLMGMMSVAYKRFGLKTHGSLPGSKCKFDGEIIGYAYPPIADFDPRLEDWAEVVWEKAGGNYFLCPLENYSIIPLSDFTHVGQEFEATSSQFLALMEDIGVLKKTGPLKELIPSVSENWWRFKQLLSGSLRSIYTFTFIDVPPDYYQRTTFSIIESDQEDVRLDVDTDFGVYMSI